MSVNSEEVKEGTVSVILTQITAAVFTSFEIEIYMYIEII